MTESQKPRHVATHARQALAIFALLAGIYLLMASGHTYAIDEELLFGVTESLVLRGSFALNNPQDTGERPLYSLFGPGQSLAALPLYHLGRTLAFLFPDNAYAWVTRAIVLWFNPLVTAGIGALLYLAAVRAGYSQHAATGTALIYGLATTALPHSKTFFSEPLTGFFLFASFVTTLYALPSGFPVALASHTTHKQELRRSHRSLLYLCLAGALAGLTPAVRIPSAIGVPLLGLYVMVCVVWLYLVQRAEWTRSWTRDTLWSVATHLLAWGAGAGLTLGLLGLFQWLHYGSPLESGYGNNAHVLHYLFRNNILRGLYGLVLSPGKGIIVYAPPLLLLPVALWLCWRRTWHIALLCSLMVIAHLLLYARFRFWHGDGAWGPRYLNTILPFLSLPLVAYLDRLRSWRTPIQFGVLLVVLLLAVPVQIGALAINFNPYFLQSKGAARYYQPLHSPVVHHLETVATQLRHLYAWHSAGNRVVLLRGFAYSEGNRDRGQQVPRWTLPLAEIALRPPPAQHLWLTLDLSSCYPSPLPPGEVTVSVNARLWITTTPCPPRIYRLLFPVHPTTLSLDSTPWDPLSVQIKREDGPFGIRLRAIEAVADGQTLPVDGAIVPVAPLPPGAGPVSIRTWVNDYRYEHWDFWWWYLMHSGFPTGPSLVLVGIWLTIATSLIGWGGWILANVLPQTRIEESHAC